MNGLDALVQEAARTLNAARSLVVSTGAGISKESGIPTFRDAPNALWENYDPEELASPGGFIRNPGLVWQWYNDRRAMIAAAIPNPGHHAIAQLQGMFDRFTLITQNIDNLHRRA
jgi:NAD-dependent deacetylase